MPIAEVYLSVQEAGKLLGVDPETIRIYCRDGRLRARKAGRKWVIAESDLAEWLDSPTRRITEKSVTAKRLLRTILRMSPEEIELAANMLHAARSLYNLEQHISTQEDE